MAAPCGHAPLQGIVLRLPISKFLTEGSALLGSASIIDLEVDFAESAPQASSFMGQLAADPNEWVR